MSTYPETGDANFKCIFQFFAVSTKITQLTFLPKLYIRTNDSSEFLALSTKMTDLTLLSMLYTWTNASKLGYVKMLSYANILIPDICGQMLKKSELQKY